MKIDLDNGVIDDSLFIGVLLSFLVLSSFIYTIISYGLVRKYKKILKHNFSFDERINLRWLQLWILGFASIFFVIAGVVLLRNAIGYVFGFNIDLVFYTMVISLVLILGYFGISHEGIFAKTVVLVDRKQDLSYKKSGLKEEEVKGVKAKLQIVISEEKPYLNPKLTLSGLAKLVGTTPNTLSQVLNHYEKVNFYDFINVYRIEEFKRQAAKNPNFTILALAYDAGFNSKSSFNGLFKKHTGITPSKYISTVHTKA